MLPGDFASDRCSPRAAAKRIFMRRFFGSLAFRAAAAFDDIAMKQRTEENRALRTEVELLRSMVSATVR
jgi:hypothetical protein